MKQRLLAYHSVTCGRVRDKTSAITSVRTRGTTARKMDRKALKMHKTQETESADARLISGFRRLPRDLGDMVLAYLRNGIPRYGWSSEVFLRFPWGASGNECPLVFVLPDDFPARVTPLGCLLVRIYTFDAIGVGVNTRVWSHAFADNPDLFESYMYSSVELDCMSSTDVVCANMRRLCCEAGVRGLPRIPLETWAHAADKYWCYLVEEAEFRSVAASLANASHAIECVGLVRVRRHFYAISKVDAPGHRPRGGWAPLNEARRSRGGVVRICSPPLNAEQVPNSNQLAFRDADDDDVVYCKGATPFHPTALRLHYDLEQRDFLKLTVCWSCRWLHAPCCDAHVAVHARASLR